MGRFAPYILKTLWRHRTRTLLTVSGAAAALFVFAFLDSARQGLAQLTEDRKSQRTLVVFQANRFCPMTSQLPEDYGGDMAKVPGVKEVVPIQVFINNCRASLDLVLFHGIPPDKLSKTRELRMVAGNRAAFDTQTDGALVGQALATRRNLVPGQRFTIGEITVTVVGIFTAPTTAEENLAYTHLSFLQRTKGRNAVGIVTQFEVHLEDDAEPDVVARQIDALFRDRQVPTDTRTKGAFQTSVVGDLAELIGWANYLGYACLGLVLTMTTTTTVMGVQDRIREHAVLQAIGFSGPRIFGLVLSEGLIVSLAGGLLGVGAALVFLGFFPLALGTEGVTIALTATPLLALRGIVVSLLVGLLSSLFPAWKAARADIVPSLRQL